MTTPRRTRPLVAADAAPAAADLEQPTAEATPDAAGARWLTVAEAAEAADCSTGTIRRWYGAGDVPSEMRPGPHGPERVMPAAAVRERAARSGRSPADFDAALAELDQADAGAGEAAAAASAGTLPPDMLPVPRAAWDRMVEQLGNLHAAGQELAEARERAAKAETEAAFLRDRLAEMRADLEARQAATASRRRWWQRPAE